VKGQMHRKRFLAELQSLAMAPFVSGAGRDRRRV
jgi:hypothetical protein